MAGALVQVGEREWCLLICMHHIISDGWSMQVLLEELVAFYRSESLGELEQAEPLVTQYADYAIWQREQLSGAELERQLAWWKAQLGDEHPPWICLPIARAKPSGMAVGPSIPSTFPQNWSINCANQPGISRHPCLC